MTEAKYDMLRQILTDAELSLIWAALIAYRIPDEEDELDELRDTLLELFT